MIFACDFVYHPDGTASCNSKNPVSWTVSLAGIIGKTYPNISASTINTFINQTWKSAGDVLTGAYFGNIPVDSIYHEVQYDTIYNNGQNQVIGYIKTKLDPWLNAPPSVKISTPFKPFTPITQPCVAPTTGCPTGQHQDLNTCNCVCNNSLCPTGQTLDPNTCNCSTTPICTKTAKDCTANQTFDPKTCTCITANQKQQICSLSTDICNKQNLDFDATNCKCVAKATSDNTLWYVLGGLVLLGGAGAGYYYYSKSKKGKSVNSGELVASEPARATKTQYMLELSYDSENINWRELDNKIYSVVGRYSDGSGMDITSRVRDHDWYFDNKSDAEAAKSRLQMN